MRLQERRRTSKNVYAAMAQVTVSGAVYFFLYRYLFRELGVEQLGIWSIVLAAASVSRIGDFGLSAAVVRFVALARADQDHVRGTQIIDTVSLTLAVLMAALLILALPLFEIVLQALVPASSLETSVLVLPYALISFWGTAVASVFLGGLDGCQRIDLRSVLVATSHVAYLALAIVWVPEHGLKGVALAQAVQATGLMLAARLALRSQLRSFGYLPTQWHSSVLKQLLRFGLSFQVTNLMALLLDPLIKVILAAFGGLATLGYYEMINKLIVQARSVVVEATRVLVPVVSALKERSKLQQLFIASYRTVFLVSTLYYASLAALIPSISLVWVGGYEPVLVQLGLVLTLGWFVNTLNGPSYFSNLGTGELRDNVICQAIIGVGSPTAAIFLGIWLGGLGVASGLALGLIGGSVFLVLSSMKRAGLNWRATLIPEGIPRLLIASAALVTLSNVFAFFDRDSFAAVLGIGVGCSAIAIALGWIHPIRKELLAALRNPLEAAG